MKKIYLALMCMASLSMMTACGGDKKAANGEAGNTAENENNQEMVENGNGENEAQDTEEQATPPEDEAFLAQPEEAAPLDVPVIYATGDFKPATTVIFQDTLGGETAGELPSKWDILEGSAEVNEVAGYKYITLSGGSARIFPLVNDGSKEYLPETYTLEFEALFGKDYNWEVQFFTHEDWGIGSMLFTPYYAEWNMTKTNEETLHGTKDELQNMFNIKGWNHIAISFDKGNMKLFANGKRFANLANIMKADYIVLMGHDAEGQTHYIRNVRIAK